MSWTSQPRGLALLPAIQELLARVGRIQTLAKVARARRLLLAERDARSRAHT